MDPNEICLLETHPMTNSSSISKLLIWVWDKDDTFLVLYILLDFIYISHSAQPWETPACRVSSPKPPHGQLPPPPPSQSPPLILPINLLSRLSLSEDHIFFLCVDKISPWLSDSTFASLQEVISLQYKGVVRLLRVLSLLLSCATWRAHRASAEAVLWILTKAGNWQRKSVCRLCTFWNRLCTFYSMSSTFWNSSWTFLRKCLTILTNLCTFWGSLCTIWSDSSSKNCCFWEWWAAWQGEWHHTG